MPRSAYICAIAYGESIQVLLLPNDTDALRSAPPAAAIQNIASATKIAKYTHVEIRVKRVRNSKPAIVAKLAIRRAPARRAAPRSRRSRRPRVSRERARSLRPGPDRRRR